MSASVGEPGRCDLAQVLEATVSLLKEREIAGQILGIEIHEDIPLDHAALVTLAAVVLHTAELRARLAEWIGTTIANFCTLSAQVEAIGAEAVDFGPPPLPQAAECQPANVAELVAIRQALHDVAATPNAPANLPLPYLT